MFLRSVLPEHHLNTETKDIVKLGIGLVATMAALVLGLVIASAQGNFSTQQNDFSQMSTNMILLDRILAHYGTETKEARDRIRRVAFRTLNRFSPEKNSQTAQLDPLASKSGFIFEKIEDIKPQNDDQRSIKEQALSIALNLAQTRWLMFAETGGSIRMPFLVLLVFWITLILVSFGLFSPTNATVIITMFLCALAIAGAIYLITELDQPFRGLIQISTAPLRDTIAHLGQ